MTARKPKPAAREAAWSRAEVRRLFQESGYDLYVHAGYLIRSAHQRATTRFQAVMQGHSLTPTQMATLATILREGELSQNHLGRLTSMDPSTISIVVRKLLRDRLVQRVGSDTDQRMSMISLTDRGVRYALSILPLGVAVSRSILSPLSPAEQVVFLSLLKRVAEGDEAQKPAAELREPVSAGRPSP